MPEACPSACDDAQTPPAPPPRPRHRGINHLDVVDGEPRTREACPDAPRLWEGAAQRVALGVQVDHADCAWTPELRTGQRGEDRIGGCADDRVVEEDVRD